METFNKLNDILGKIRKSDDYVLKSAKELKLVLYSLQIEDAKIVQENGIDAITRELERIINGIQKDVNELIEQNRANLGIVLDELKKICSEETEN